MQSFFSRIPSLLATLLTIAAFVLCWCVAVPAHAHAPLAGSRAAKPIVTTGYMKFAPSKSRFTNITSSVVTDTLMLSGANFLPSSQVSINGTPLETFFVNSNTLKVYLPPALLQIGDYTVTVTNPPAGGGTATLTQTLTITNPSLNPLAMEFSTTTRHASYQGWDETQDSIPSAADSGFIARRLAPIIRRERLDAKVFKDGTCSMTITDLTKLTDVIQKDEFLHRRVKVTVINPIPEPDSTAPTRRAIATCYDSTGTVLWADTVAAPYFKTMIDSLKNATNPCLAPPPMGQTMPVSMPNFVAKLQASGASVADLGGGRQEVTVSMPGGTSALFIVNVAQNYMESSHVLAGGARTSSTYYTPKQPIGCIPEYASARTESYSRLAGGARMKNISIIDYEQTSVQNFLTPTK